MNSLSYGGISQANSGQSDSGEHTEHTPHSRDCSFKYFDDSHAPWKHQPSLESHSKESSGSDDSHAFRNPTRLESTGYLLSRILKNLREVCISELAVQAGFWRNQAQIIASASDQRLPAKFPLSGWFSFQPAGESRNSLPKICNRGYVERVACQQWIKFSRNNVNNVTLASRWCWTVWLPHFLSKMASVVFCTQRELELPWEG